MEHLDFIACFLAHFLFNMEPLFSGEVAMEAEKLRSNYQV